MTTNKPMPEPLKNTAVMVVFVLLLGVLYAGGWLGFESLFGMPVIFVVVYTLVFILGGGLLGAWLWVFIKLPTGMAEAFDVIKNRIASREISTSRDFASVIAGFMVGYFSFFRFDVVAAQVLIKDHEPFIFPTNYQNCVPASEEVIQKSRQTEDVIALGKTGLNGKHCHRYLVPIWFGREWLGYILVFTDTRLDRMNRNFLKEFEALYIDDQLMHVLFYEQTTPASG